MKLKAMLSVIVVIMAVVCGIQAAPEDRFLGATRDGYDKGCFIQLYGEIRFRGTVYDGFAISSITNTNPPLSLMRGLVLIIR